MMSAMRVIFYLALLYIAKCIIHYAIHFINIRCRIIPYIYIVDNCLQILILA